MRGLRLRFRGAVAPVRAVASAALLAAGLAAGCADTASKAECEKLLDHLIELEVVSAGADKLSPERKADLDKQKQEISGLLREEFVKKCEAESPGSRVRCGLKARTAEDLARCDKE